MPVNLVVSLRGCSVVDRSSLHYMRHLLFDTFQRTREEAGPIHSRRCAGPSSLGGGYSPEKAGVIVERLFVGVQLQWLRPRLPSSPLMV